MSICSRWGGAGAACKGVYAGLRRAVTGLEWFLVTLRAAAPRFQTPFYLVARTMSFRPSNSSSNRTPAALIPAAPSPQAYLMFGDRSYLDMFVTLYTSAMAHMRLPGVVGGPRKASFLVDINMHNGRMAKVWVSSLGAFWPAMQALAGG